MDREIQERLLNLRPIRWLVTLVIFCRGAIYLLVGNRYRGISEFCWVVRVSGIKLLQRLAFGVVDGIVSSVRRGRANILIDSYRSNRESVTCALQYSIAGPGSKDIFRDLIVLKSASASESGVILLKYVRTFEAVISLFDVSRLMERYLFVLEPCWAGYCDPSIMMFLAHGHPVVVQCFTEDDFDFIAKIGLPFVPVRLGPADWVDADVFKPSSSGQKVYDLVMVANWAAHKRHAQLFRALNEVRDRKVRVLLIGFPWGGRTAADIRRDEARAVKNHHLVQIDIMEQLPQSKLAAHLSGGKVFVFLSRKEGDNKALVEALFADVPAIVFDQTIGGARSRINSATGVFASDEELAMQIVYMLEHYREFSPRAWALENTGSANATRELNGLIKRISVDAGRSWSEDIVEKINSPNLEYKDRTCRARFQADYEFVISCRRNFHAGSTS